MLTPATSIHCAGAAVAAARVRGLDADQTAHAMAIALYQPPFGLWPGFMGPDTKLLTASEPLFLAVKYAGAAYLIYLGAQALREAIWPARGRDAHSAAVPYRRLAPIAAFRQGFVSDLGNPKIAVFFPSLLPQFVPTGQPSFLSLLLLGFVFALITFTWLTVYATAVAKAGDWLRRPTGRRVVEAVSGTLLIGLGIRIAAEQR